MYYSFLHQGQHVFKMFSAAQPQKKFLDTQRGALALLWSEDLSVTCDDGCLRPYVITSHCPYKGCFFFTPPPISYQLRLCMMNQ